jgi:hypothetical protein
MLQTVWVQQISCVRLNPGVTGRYHWDSMSGERIYLCGNNNLHIGASSWNTCSFYIISVMEDGSWLAWITGLSGCWLSLEQSTCVGISLNMVWMWSERRRQPGRLSWGGPRGRKGRLRHQGQESLDVEAEVEMQVVLKCGWSVREWLVEGRWLWVVWGRWSRQPQWMSLSKCDNTARKVKLWV